MPTVNTPSDVIDPIAAISAAENDVVNLDILVCGNCQAVFHFVEEFRDHKEQNDCERADKNVVNQQQSNKKPQVWAFLIWKNSQQKADDQDSSWKLYQRWCNMAESQRQSWITAGRNIQTFINLSHARDLNKLDCISKNGDQDTEDEVEEDFIVEKIVGKRYNHKKKQVEYLLKWEGYPPEQNTWEPLSNLTTCKSLLQEYERCAAQVDKGFNSRLSGLLKKDSTPSQVKLTHTSVSKPSGLVSMKYGVLDKKNEPTTPTLQTQRKIVPVTPIANSVTPTKISTPLVTSIKSESAKTAETHKLSNSIEAGTTDTNKLSKSSLNSTPLKKRLISNSEDSPKAASPEKTVALENPKSNESSKEWCITLNESDPLPIKRLSDTPEPADESKRIKLNDTSSKENFKSEETVDIPRSGIFKKSELREKYSSSNDIFGKSLSELADSKSMEPKNGESLRGLLKVDHAQMPDLMSGVYRMSVTAGVAKLELVTSEKHISATLPTMPGPKGGVVILGNRFDLSKVVKATPSKSPSSCEKSGVLKEENPAFRGSILKTKVGDESPVKALKPDFHSKTLSITDSTKKPVNSALRKVLGGTVPTRKGKTSLGSPTGISRFKPNFVKSFNDSFSEISSSRLGDGDGLLLEFNDIENSEVEEYALPDDFPEELNMEPLSPSRPLTLDPETGKRLMRAEGEPTPQPTPEPSPEPSPVPSPVPSQMICKQENETLNGNGNLILKASEVGEGTYEINGNTYKVTSADQVELLQNAAFTQSDGISVTASITDEGEAGSMLTITGDDGLVYQVANAKLEGDTIVVASGEDDQHCVFVTEDGHQVMQRTNEDGSTVLTLEGAYADAVAQLVPNQVNILPDGSQIYVKQEEDGQVELVQIQGSTEMGETEAAEQEEQQNAEPAEENSGQVVAQLIEAGEPAPGGGPRRVVLLLPDGNLMVTEVDEEQFAALELEK